MRVVQLIDSLQIGGAERMAVNISNALVEDNNQVLLVATRNDGPLIHQLSDKVATLFLSKRSAIDIGALLRFIKAVRAFHPNVIHAHSSSVFWALLLKFALPSSILVWHDHNGARAKMESSKNVFYRIASLFIDRIISVNVDLLNWARTNMFVSSNNTVYIPNFPYLSNFKREKKTNQVNILCVANFRFPKDHLNLAQALQQIIHFESCNSKITRLVLVGNYDTNSLYFKQFWDYCEQYNLTDLVQLVGGSNDVEVYLSQATIGVVSSTSEGLPVSLLEYGLAGLPVVVTDVGQCSEVVGYGLFGRMVPPSNPKRLAEEIVHLINDPLGADEMGQAFQKHITNNYGSQKFLSQYYHLLKK